MYIILGFSPKNEREDFRGFGSRKSDSFSFLLYLPLLSILMCVERERERDFTSFTSQVDTLDFGGPDVRPTAGAKILESEMHM